MAILRDKLQTPAQSELVLELRRLAAEVAALREGQEHLLRRLLERDDARTGAVLLPLAAEVHGEAFAPAELLAAALNARTASGQALREVLSEHLDADGGCSALGRLFKRINGAVLGGCRLVREGESRLGTRYRVQVIRP